MEAKFDTATKEDKLKSIPLSDEDFQSLITFFVTGNRAFDKSKIISEKKLIPIHFKKWQEEESGQNFPLYFLKQDFKKVAIPLNEVFENLSVDIENQHNEKSTSVFNDLKFHVKSHLNGFSEEQMKNLWDKSIKSMLENISEPLEKETIEKTLKMISSKNYFDY